MFERLKWWLWSLYARWKLRNARWKKAEPIVRRAPRGALPRPERAVMRTTGLPPLELRVKRRRTQEGKRDGR